MPAPWLFSPFLSFPRSQPAFRGTCAVVSLGESGVARGCNSLAAPSRPPPLTLVTQSWATEGAKTGQAWHLLPSRISQELEQASCSPLNLAFSKGGCKLQSLEVFHAKQRGGSALLNMRPLQIWTWLQEVFMVVLKARYSKETLIPCWQGAFDTDSSKRQENFLIWLVSGKGHFVNLLCCKILNPVRIRFKHSKLEE